MRCLSNIAVILLLLGLQIPAVRAQSMQFNLQVEPEIKTEVVQSLDFGTVIANSGKILIEPGSPQMGIFEITTMNNKHIRVSLSYPDQLQNANNPGSTDTIPLTLHARYTPYKDASFETATGFNGNSAYFNMGRPGPSGQHWSVARVYVFGSANVGNVAEGTYTGTIVMEVVIN